MNTINLARQISVNRRSLERTIPQYQKTLGEAQLQLATGKRINRPSDDSSGYATARAMDTVLRRYDQYESTIASSRLWTDTTQATLDSLSELLTGVYEDSLQAANDTTTDEDRATIAIEVRSQLEEMVDLLNSKVGDEYLFAGNRTVLPTPSGSVPESQPFVLDDASLAVTYFGDSGTRTRTIGDGVEVDVNIAGDRVLNPPDGGASITDRLAGLITALESNDTAAITTAVDEVLGARDHLLNLSAESGSTANRLTLAETQLAEARVNTEARRSRAEDADLAETSLDLQQAQTGLEVALQAVATVSQVSLLDYLR